MNFLMQCTLSDGKPCLACERQANLHVRMEATRNLLDKSIVQQCEALEDIDFRRQHELFEKLRVEEREARQDINRRHDPFNRLPYEITSYIFCLTLPDFRVRPQEQASHRRRHSGKEYCEHQGLTLGAVCRAWRNLAWSTPTLWCNIMVTLHSEPTWNRVDVMYDWLERSKPLPLHISLFLVDKKYVQTAEDYYDDNGTSSNCTRRSETLEAFVDIFNLHSARWETLSIESPFWLSGRLIGHEDHGAPRLKTLQLMNVYSDYCTFELQGPQPAPTRVTATGYSHVDDLGICWSNVTHATLSYLTLHSYTEFLRLVPRLVELNLQHISWHPFFTAAPEPLLSPIRLPLQKLSVSSESPLHDADSEVFYSIIFDSLMLPLLEDLTIIQTERPFESVKRLLARSCPPLKNLVMNIECDPFDQQEALDFLYTLPPSLTKILLDWKPPIHRSSQDSNLHILFDHLARLPTVIDGYPTEPLARPQLLPNIEWFEYHIYRESSEDPALWGRLPDILRPCSGSPRPLKVLAFSERSAIRYRDAAPPFLYKGLGIEESVVRGIIRLLEAGVDVRLPNSVCREDLLALLED